LKSAVLERQGQAIRFNPVLLGFAGHHRYEPRPVAVARGNEKGRVERAIRYIRDNFFAGRTFTGLNDLNAQAEAWMTGLAADRRCPEDTTLTVREAFALESKQLLALPENPYQTDEQVVVKVGKTAYVRFDLNDYSVPHDAVQRTLTVVADLQEVRILDGQDVLASRLRSFDRGLQIEIPAHIEALLEHKHQASQHRGTDRLSQAVPQSRELLIQAADRGEPLGRITAALLRLLDRYGATELQAGIQRRPCNAACRTRMRYVSPWNVDVRRRVLYRRRSRLSCPVIYKRVTHLFKHTRWTRTTKSRRLAMTPLEHLQQRAKDLHLYGLLAHWHELIDSVWIEPLLIWEEAERAKRSLERRLGSAHIGRFKLLADFDWNWPEQCEQTVISELLSLEFLKTATNVILVGASGLGKSTIAQNIAHHAVIHGHTRSIHHGWPTAWRSRRPRQRFGAASALALLCGACFAGHR